MIEKNLREGIIEATICASNYQNKSKVQLQQNHRNALTLLVTSVDFPNPLQTFNAKLRNQARFYRKLHEFI